MMIKLGAADSQEIHDAYSIEQMFFTINEPFLRDVASRWGRQFNARYLEKLISRNMKRRKID